MIAACRFRLPQYTLPFYSILFHFQMQRGKEYEDAHL
eukprot:COSAG04_NODE_23453_length_338_cov_0.857741_2_plen_36_part_01